MKKMFIVAAFVAASMFVTVKGEVVSKDTVAIPSNFKVEMVEKTTTNNWGETRHNYMAVITDPATGKSKKVRVDKATYESGKKVTHLIYNTNQNGNKTISKAIRR